MQKITEQALEIGKADIAIHHETFYLMEHRRMGDIGITAIHPSRCDGTQRWFTVFHYTNLYRRGMGTQHGMLIKIKGIVHGARRMIFRNIQRGEIVIIILDLRSLSDFKTGLGKQCFDTFQCLCDGVSPAGMLATSRQRDINTLIGNTRRQRSFL